jgi:hypothetical protein
MYCLMISFSIDPLNFGRFQVSLVIFSLLLVVWLQDFSLVFFTLLLLCWPELLLVVMRATAARER